MRKLLTNNQNKKLMKQYNLNLNSWNSFLSFSIAKLRQESHENKHLSVFFMRLLRQEPSFATKEEKSMNCCRDSWGLSESLNVAESLLAIPVYWAR